ncbi:MAG: AAA family ATPase [Candidatus Saccharibacteria bacterium]|nr:AAA family ATPase [Candidatus Saccharibacteria bacterium]
MIFVSNIAARIERFLKSKEVEKFKIFIRLNFEIDVFVFTSNVEAANSYYDEFLDEQKNDKDCRYIEPLLSNETGLKPFKIVSLDRIKDPFYKNILRDEEKKIEYGPRYRFGSMLENALIYDKNEKAFPVVTFYSYKGGVGRTTTLMSYAIHLAKNLKKRVVVVDCDLEAPGYLNFFNLSKIKDLKTATKNGLVEFICDSLFCNNRIDINDYIIDVSGYLKSRSDKDEDCSACEEEGKECSDHEEDAGKIWVVPAGNLNESCAEEDVFVSHQRDYLEGLAKIDFSNAQTLAGNFQLLFEKLQNDCNIRPDIVLIDSRTGFNDILGTVALGISDQVVGFFGQSRQTEPGFMNLLAKYCKSNGEFDLHLVYSILPEGVNGGSKEMTSFLERMCNKYKVRMPDNSSIHRKDFLEKVGTGNEGVDEIFRKKMSNVAYDSDVSDFRELFGSINKLVFNDVEEISYATAQREVVLKHLRNTLEKVQNFAENANIDESQFFYRKCMKEFFVKDKFLIQGYKGTGKTYLYRALSEPSISDQLKKWAENNDEREYVFLHILPETPGAKSFDFVKVRTDVKIENPAYYFDRFWTIYTWSTLLFDDGNEELSAIRKRVREKSRLKDFISRMDNEQASKDVDNLIADENTFISIEEDLKAFDDELKANGKVVFALYDRLDQIVWGTKWSACVSALIDYWRRKYASFECILPKIFVRTDLFKQNKIRGTNTAMLSYNTISLEWNVAEIFAYFFKLIFSNREAGVCFWNFCKQLKISDQYLDSVSLTYEKDNLNQFRSLNEAEMVPLVRAFFGSEVKTEDGDYGKPWNYFEKELANADHDSISLRPFINTLNFSLKKLFSKSMDDTATEMIPPTVYASRECRVHTADEYFNDLSRDGISADLLEFREIVLNNPADYGYTSLPERIYNSLIHQTFMVLQEKAKVEERSTAIEKEQDLKDLIDANGIMVKTVTSMGIFYRFAPIYWFAWGLENSVIENEEKKQIKKIVIKKFKPLSGSRLLGRIRVDQYQQVYVSVSMSLRKGEREFKYPVREKLPKYCRIGDLVTFHVGEEPNLKNPNKVYTFAYDIQIETQKIHEVSGKNDIPDFGSQNDDENSGVKSSVRLVGIFKSNNKGRYVSISYENGKKTREYMYAYRDPVPNGIAIGDLVSFSVGEEPHPYKINAVFRYAYDLRKENNSLLESQKKQTQHSQRIKKENPIQELVQVNETPKPKGFWARMWKFLTQGV